MAGQGYFTNTISIDFLCKCIGAVKSTRDVEVTCRASRDGDTHYIDENGRYDVDEYGVKHYISEDK